MTAASTGRFDGPRLETPAEIGLIAAHAEVIGMTIASECVVAGELGLRYAAVCLVDNLANGVGETELTVAEFDAGRAANRERLAAALEAVVAGTCSNPSMALTVSGATLAGERVGLRAVDGVIDAIGPEVEAQPGDEVLDATRLALVPGLVNAHTHAAMTLFRGYADDLPLMEWLQRAHLAGRAAARARGRLLGHAARVLGDDPHRARSGSGTCTGSQAETARAVKDAGLRAVVGAPLIDNKDPAGAPRLLEKARRTIDEIVEAGERAVTAGARTARDLHGLRAVAARDRRASRPSARSRSRSTSPRPRARCSPASRRPACDRRSYLDRCGLLGPRTLLAHCVWLDRDEIDLIVERGATMVTNPVANMKLAVGGIFPYLEAREAGAQVALGTDGAGSNNSLDMLDDVKAFALLQKHVAADPAAVTAREAWEIATGQRSDLVGEPSLTQGARADFALVRLNSPGLALGKLDAGLVYAADASAVAVTVVGGRVVYRQGERAEAEEIIARARERAKLLLSS